MSEIVFSRRPVAVRGPVNSGVARVVADDSLIVIVTGHSKTTLAAEGEFVSVAPNKWKVETDHGTLTVVKGGGCTCGKPWMTKPSDAELLAAAHLEYEAVNA